MTNDDRTSLGRRTVLGVTGLGILGLGAVSGSGGDEHKDDNGDSESDGYDPDEILDDWDQKQTETARKMMNKYGDPDEVIPSRLIWHQEDDGNAPWKHTIVYRDPVPHNFPMKHQDFLEQEIDLHIPPDQYDEVATFDGSVILERTKGEVAARCDKEPMNFLAVNLTHELVNTDMTVEEARRTYAEDAKAFMNGEKPPRTQGFQFELPEDDQRDPDVEIIKDGEIEQDQDLGPETEGGETDAGTGDNETDAGTGDNETDAGTGDNETTE